MENNDFQEFSEIVGTKISEDRWYVHFDKRGFVRGIQGPGKSPSHYYWLSIRNMLQAKTFLLAHKRPDLINGLLKIGFRGNSRERIYK